MKKRILSIMLCLCMAISLLPMSALAAEYNSWDEATAGGVTPAIDDTITIDNIGYTYKGEADTSGIQMYSGDGMSYDALTEAYCWKAGSGYVLYNPTVESGKTTSAEVTLHNATISTESATALDLPISGNMDDGSFPVPVTVYVEDENSLATSDADKCALDNDGGSDTLITGGGTLSLTNSASSGLYSSIGGTVVTIDSGTQVTVSGGSENTIQKLAVTGSDSKLTIVSGTKLNIINICTVDEGAVLENNGTLKMMYRTKDDRGITGEISGSGGIVFSSESETVYCLVDGEFIPYGGDVSTGGLNLSGKNNDGTENSNYNAPTITTRYKAGDGYIIYTPATADPAANAKLELHDAVINTTSGRALFLPADAQVDIVVAGDSSVTAGGSANVIYTNGQALSVTGSGNLTLAGNSYGINVNGTGAVSINIDGDLTFDTVYQPISTSGDITVSAKSITSNSGYYFQSGSGSVSLTATDGDIVFDETGKTNKQEKIRANGDITLNAPSGKIDITHGGSGCYALNSSSGAITMTALNDVIINASSGGDISSGKTATSDVVSVNSTNGSIQMSCGDYYECVEAYGGVALAAAKDITLNGTENGSSAIQATGQTISITAGGKLYSATAFGIQVGTLTIQADEVSIAGTSQDGVGASSVSITNPTGGNCKSVSVTATSSSDSWAAIRALGTADTGNITVKADELLICGNDSAKAISALGTVTISGAGLIVGAMSVSNTSGIDSRIICAANGGDKSGGLNLSSPPTEATVYTAGSGYALFTPATTTPAAPAKLTLHNAMIYNTTAINDATGTGIALPDGAITIVLEAVNTVGAQYANAIWGTNTDVTLSGSGVLNVGYSGISLESTAANPHALTKSANVTLNGIVTTYDNSSVNSDSNANTVYGSMSVPADSHCALAGTITVVNGAVLTIPQGTTLDSKDAITIANNGTIVNNGTLLLSDGTAAAAIKILKLTGTGVVKVGSNFYTNGGVAVKEIIGGLDLATGSHSGATLESDGYSWDGSTLILGSVYLGGGLTLPCNTVVTINTTGNSSISGGISAASDGSGYSHAIDLTFTGTGPMTISGAIIGGVNGDTVTVQGGARVTMSGSISIGASGTDGTLNVFGAGTVLNITSDSAYGVMCDTVNVQNGAHLIAKANGTGTTGVEALSGGVSVTNGATLETGCDYGVYIIGGKLTVDSTSKLITNGAVAPFCIVGVANSAQSDVLSLAVDLPSGTVIASRQATNGSGTTHTYWSLVPTNGNLTVSDTDNTPVTLTGAVTGTLTFAKAASTPTGGGSGSSSYTLTFETNGGSTINELSKTAGSIVDLSEYKPTRDGYTFAGWYSDAELTNKITSVTLTKNTTVYAKWTEKIANPFADVSDNDYYYDAVLWAVKNGVTGGTSNTAFSPDMTCTRAQMITFLWRAEGSPEPTSADCPFTDVAQNAYYYKAVLWAVEKGITAGTSATTFGSDDIVTRGQAVTFLWRAAGKLETTTANPFADVTEDAYYYDAVLWAVEKGITQGTSAESFSPDSSCTRAQIVTFLYRYAGE